jgi:hypothetical protein
MAIMPNKAPFAAFKIGVVTIAFFDFLAWLLVLGGISALEAVCPFGCRAAYGLSWFIIWFQFILIVPAVFVEFFDTAAAWRSTIMMMLAINTVLSILQVEKLLNLKDTRGSTRLNAAIAGFIIQSIFNLLLILLSGSRTAMNSAYGEDRDVGVATYPAKTRAPAPTNDTPQVTTPPPQSTYMTTGATAV